MPREHIFGNKVHMCLYISYNITINDMNLSDRIWIKLLCDIISFQIYDTRKCAVDENVVFSSNAVTSSMLNQICSRQPQLHTQTVGLHLRKMPKIVDFILSMKAFF